MLSKFAGSIKFRSKSGSSGFKGSSGPLTGPASLSLFFLRSYFSQQNKSAYVKFCHIVDFFAIIHSKILNYRNE